MLKLLLLTVALAIAAWMFLRHPNAVPEIRKAEAKVDNQATRYAQGLQNDVKKAEDVQKQADAVIHQQTEAIGKALKDADGQNP